MIDIFWWIDYLWVWEDSTHLLIVCLLFMPTLITAVSLLEVGLNDDYKKPVTILTSIFFGTMLLILFPVPIIGISAIYALQLVILEIRKENDL